MPGILEIAYQYGNGGYDWGGPREGTGPYNGTIDVDGNGKLDIDCSNLVNQVLQQAGYNLRHI